MASCPPVVRLLFVGLLFPPRAALEALTEKRRDGVVLVALKLHTASDKRQANRRAGLVSERPTYYAEE